MTAQIINGREVANRIAGELKETVGAIRDKLGYPPALAVVLVGEDPASAMYVRMKRRRATGMGIADYTAEFPDDATQEEVIAQVRAYNEDPKVHGILVQLPLPDHIDEEAVLREISLEKDVDGIHPINVGYLAQKGRQPTFTPATPTGCMTLIAETGIDVSGKLAVVLGRSNIVGIPMALMLNNANATVTIVHSRTPNTPEIVKQADIVVAAIGRPNYVQGDWIKPGAVVIDVGTNRIEDERDERGYRWVGDVDFEAAKDVAGAITVVPGGVGPLTIMSLMQNTVKAAKIAAGID